MTTIHQVAQAAGVSISTVSYALSGNRPVAPDTRRRILAAATELGYEPNAGARMLAGRRTHIFALTEPLRIDTHAPTHMNFVLAASIAARRNDYDILLLTDEQASAGMRRVAATDLVDAILVLDVAPGDERVAIARSIDIPTVFIGIPDDHAGLNCVDLDFEGAARLALGRLAEAGHRHVALIGQPAVTYERSNFPPRVQRAARAAAESAGIAFSFATSGHTGHDAAVTAAAVRDALGAGATALMLHGGDDMHRTVLGVLDERALVVGADVSLVSLAASFDTTNLPVPVDTIPLVPAESCELAVELALRALGRDAPDPAVHLIDPVYLAVGSVAPPPR